MTTNEAQELKLYEVTHRATGERHYAVDYNAQDACLQSGWAIGDCYVLEQKPITKLDKHERAILFVKIPCKVCPYQFTECNKVSDTDCPIRPETEDPKQWLNQIAKARICPHVGEDLGKRDYEKRLKRVTLDQAINELADKLPPPPPYPSELTCQTPLTMS
jgi:rubredoxin